MPDDIKEKLIELLEKLKPSSAQMKKDQEACRRFLEEDYIPANELKKDQLAEFIVLLMNVYPASLTTENLKLLSNFRQELNQLKTPRQSKNR